MTLREEFDAIAARRPDAEMAWWNGASITYADAARHADALAPRLGGGRTMALVVGKSLTAYATIWASIRNGACYVPLNPDWNVSRLVNVLDRVRPELVAADPAWAETNRSALTALGYRDAAAPMPAAGGDVPPTLLERSDGAACTLADYTARAGVEDLVYVMFTSGSTGVPKGVPIHHAALEHYVGANRETFSLPEGERWTQLPHLNFDLSIHDLMVGWGTGGCVVGVPAEKAPLGPRFVRRLEVHNWTSVPSAIGRAISLGLAKPGALPSLRRSFFCGEALPGDTAAQWALAAPGGPVINTYGPTENTVAFTWHVFDPARDTGAVVPIGVGLPGCTVELVDEEIVHSGPQVFGGYLDDASENAAKLSTGPDGARRFRTGDRAERDADGTLHFRGRFDWQVKVRGHRVEVDEVEGALRAETGKGLAAVVPVDEEMPGTYRTLHAFIERGSAGEGLRARLSQRLPPYMVPHAVTELADFPLNSSGKIDRLLLRRMAEGGDEGATEGRAGPAA